MTYSTAMSEMSPNSSARSAPITLREHSTTKYCFVIVVQAHNSLALATLLRTQFDSVACLRA
jgi:hypothetical protein